MAITITDGMTYYSGGSVLPILVPVYSSTRRTYAIMGGNPGHETWGTLSDLKSEADWETYYGHSIAVSTISPTTAGRPYFTKGPVWPTVSATQVKARNYERVNASPGTSSIPWKSDRASGVTRPTRVAIAPGDDWCSGIIRGDNDHVLGMDFSAAVANAAHALDWLVVEVNDGAVSQRLEGVGIADGRGSCWFSKGEVVFDGTYANAQAHIAANY